MEDAHNGKVTWNTPSEIKQFIEIQQKRAKWTVRSEAEEASKKDGEKDEGDGLQTPGRDFSAAKGGRDQPYDEALAELQAEVDAASEADVGSLLRNASRGKN